VKPRNEGGDSVPRSMLDPVRYCNLRTIESEESMTAELAPASAPAATDHADKGSKFVLQPDEGNSYWQPKPANGYITIKISPDNCTSNLVTMGIQVVAPNGCYVREHWHSRNEEILFCYEGRGTILVAGAGAPAQAGCRSGARQVRRSGYPRRRAGDRAPARGA